jgi:hypothetical protein
MIYKAFVFHHLFAFIQSYFELRADRPELNFVQGMHMAAPMNTGINGSACLIPVRLPRDLPDVEALVSCEDYDKITAISPVWHLSTKGYVVSSKRVEGKQKVTFLHRVVRDVPSMHLNGDKLDNRRENVIPSNRGTKKNRRCQEEEELIIQTISPLLDSAMTPENTPFESKHCTISYHNHMTYSGEIHNYRPHGFGTLTEENKMSFGWWLQGIFKSGIIMYLKPIPSLLKSTFPIPQIKHAVLVVNEKKMI